MRTITFYSYKGGVGRSLLVANTAKFLSTIGKKVFAVDLDLEAPGLHYKFELGTGTPRSKSTHGVVNLLHDFVKTGQFPDLLLPHVCEIKAAEDAKAIHLMRAGTAPSADYWKLLAQLNWHDLFYGPKAEGVPFFLELKERIRDEFNPDYLLIDARTGLTEMSAVATTVLPDVVVCLALASPEHLDGLRELMRAIARTTARDRERVKLVPVISRYPLKKGVKDEITETTEIQSFLMGNNEDSPCDLRIDEVITLHSEPVLEGEELLLIGSKHGPHDVPLLRDYLRLLSKIIPADDISPHVGEIVRRAAARLLEDPDGSQNALEALTTYCADEDAFRALIQLYKLRKVSIDKIITSAALMWQLMPHHEGSDPLLVDVVKQGFTEIRPGETQRKNVDFAEAIWRQDGMNDPRVASVIASVRLQESRSRGIGVLRDYITNSDAPSPAVVVRLIELLRTEGRTEEALSLVSKFRKSIASPDFYVVWAKLVLDQKDKAAAERLLSDSVFRTAAVRETEPAVLYKLLRLSGADTQGVLLENALDRALTEQDMRVLSDLAEVYQEEGRLDEFEMRAEGRIPRSMVEELLGRVRKRIRPRLWRDHTNRWE